MTEEGVIWVVAWGFRKASKVSFRSVIPLLPLSFSQPPLFMTSELHYSLAPLIPGAGEPTTYKLVCTISFDPVMD
jgi:hypothetical protein